MYFLTTNEVKSEAIPANFKEIIENHIAWVKEKIAAGVILQAGKWGQTKGMCIIKADSLEQAERIIREDPLSASGAVEYLVDEYWSNVPLE